MERAAASALQPSQLHPSMERVASGISLQPRAQRTGEADSANQLVLLYSGRWRWPSMAQQQVVSSHMSSLIDPLNANARHPVVVAFAGTSSQWCSRNATSLMVDGLPNAVADRALRGELQHAFGPRVRVLARTFAEPNTTRIRSAVAAEFAWAGLRRSEGQLDWQTLRMASWQSQVIGLARAMRVWRSDAASIADRFTFVRARLDVTYARPLPQPPMYDESVVSVEAYDDDTVADECLPSFKDYTFVFSGARCLDALTTAGEAGALQHDPSIRRCPIAQSETQFALQLAAAGCSLTALANRRRSATRAAGSGAETPITEWSELIQGENGERLCSSSPS
jgi:hypothetical protein